MLTPSIHRSVLIYVDFYSFELFLFICVCVQAKLICGYNTQRNMYSLPEGNPILNTSGGGLDAWGPQQRMGLTLDTNLPTEIESNAYTRDSLMETLVGVKETDHKPLVYTLPKNTSLEQPPKLESIMDIGQMQAKFAHDICSLLGVPHGMIGQHDGKSDVRSVGASSSKIFVTNMMSICRHLKLLLVDVYLASFGGSPDDVEFIICAMPRFVLPCASMNTRENMLKCCEI